MNTFDLTKNQHTSGVLDRFLQGRPGGHERAGFASTLVQNNGAQWAVSSDREAMLNLFAPVGTASGFHVTDSTAMRVSTVYACLAKLAGSMQQLPLGHFRYDADGERKEVRDSNLYWLFNEQPHTMWKASDWKAWIVRCVALRGDQHTEILRGSSNSGGAIRGFYPHHPDNSRARVWINPDTKEPRLVYDVTDAYTGETRTVDQDDMLHFTGLGFDGVRSLSAIQYAAKQAIGNSLAGADYMGRTIGEGAMPQIALKYAGKMDKTQRKDLRDSFVETYTGVGARKLPLVLTEGGDIKELSISPVDMQLMEFLRFEKQDICQALEVPPILIGETEKTSAWGTGIEQIVLGFVKFTVRPKSIGWREEFNRKIFRRPGQFIDFDFDGLLEGDSKSQSEFFKSAMGGPGSGDGWMTPAEVRRKKNLPRKEGSDELFKAQRGSTSSEPPKGTKQ